MVEAPVDARDVLVEQSVNGVDLARVLAENGRPGLPVASVLDWMTQAAEALTDIHNNGGLHGDVQPVNIVLDQSGRIVLVDSRRNGKPPQAASFRAPEVDTGKTPDRAADVYSLAATTSALLTGDAPAARATSTLAGQAYELETTLREGLAVDPRQRPTTAGELVERLRAEWGRNAPTSAGTVLVADIIDEPLNLRIEQQLAVDRAVEDHGGRRPDATPDGHATVSLFADATGAVRAAVALQRGMQRSPEPLHVALASGELADATSDAVRVLDLAGPGQILLARSTAELVQRTLTDAMRLIAIDQSTDDAAGVVAVATVGVNSPSDPSRCPYPGLVPFSQNDSDLFFGRDNVVEQSLGLLLTERFVAIVGASGSGKSSLIQAGLLPWLPGVVLLRPGGHPAQSLADAGAADHPDAILIVDQLEEVVTLCRSTDERSAFIDAILNHPGGLAVALQADRYGDFAQFGEFAQLLSSCQVLLGPLDDDELNRVVTEPAQRCGVVVEDGLAELITTELPRSPDTLPLLGHVLRETWRRRHDSTMTRAGYREAGGVRSAIAVSAERAYGALDAREQAVARRLLPRLADVRPDGVASRWIGDTEVAGVGRAAGPSVLSSMAAAGLVVTDDGKTTVAHEAVLTVWPRLAEWIAQDQAASLVEQQRHAERNRTRLFGFLAVAAAVLALTALAIGIVAFTERDAAVEERDAARLTGLIADARAATADQPDAALLLAVEARAESTTAETTGAVVDALLAQPSVRALLPGSPSAVQTVAVEAGVVAGAAGNDVRLWSERSWQQTGGYQVGEAKISDLALSDDGRTLLVVIPDDHTLTSVDARTGQPVADPIDYGAMSPTGVVAAGGRALVVVDDRVSPSTAFRVEQRDLRTLDPVGPALVPPNGRPEDIVISADGRRAAISTTDGTIWLANLDSGEVVLGAAAPVSEADVSIDDLAWDADLLVAGRVDGSVDAWRLDSGEVLTPLERFSAGGPVDAVAAGCDGACLAAGTADGRVVAWRIGSEQIPLDVPRAHDGRVHDLEFTGDDAFLISAGSDQVTAVHALDGSVPIASAVFSGGAPARGAYDGGDTIFTGIDDAARGRIVRRLKGDEESWRTEVNGAVSWLAATDRRVVALIDPIEEPLRFMVLDAHTGDVQLDELLEDTRATGAISPDGSTVLLASRDAYGSSFVEVDLGNLSISEPTDINERVTALSMSPDGSRVVTGHATGDIAVRRLGSFDPEYRSTSRLDDSITAIDFTPDGETVVAGGWTGAVHVLDADTLEPRFAALEGHRRSITSVASNDELVLATSADGTVRMWDLAGGNPVGGPIPTGGTTAPSIAMNSAGGRALVQGDRGLLELTLDENEWVRLACSIAGRELNADERASYGLGESTNACGSG